MFLQSITAVNGEESKELDGMVNPPILSDVTDKNKEAELYSEYFMPVNEYKPSIGEYKKGQASPSAVKILCWVLSLLLLAGDIVLAVLIGSKSLFTPCWDLLYYTALSCISREFPREKKSKAFVFSGDHRHRPGQNHQSQQKSGAEP